MKLVMTLLARNEADIVDAQIAFHLHAGVDFVIATDNDSDDGTTEILERYERAGVLHLLREGGDDMRQQEWVTRMARHGRDGLRCGLGDQRRRGRVLVAARRHAQGRAGARPATATASSADAGGTSCRARTVDASFAERMTVRLVHACVPGRQDDDLPRAPEGRASRGSRTSRSKRGTTTCPGRRSSRSAAGTRSRCSTSRSGRSSRWSARRAVAGFVSRRSQLVGASDPARRRRPFRFDAGVLRPVARFRTRDLERGLADGSLAVDTRLRDALRVLRRPDGTVPSAGSRTATRVRRPRTSMTRLPTRRRPRYSRVSTESSRAEQRVAALEARLAGRA